MSISLPNGTLLAAPSSSSAQVSAAVTRILHLANFSAELKTRDLQNIFKEWEQDKGGFRIKWLDDINALVVFADANVAKRAYLAMILNPPVSMPPPATIRPYDKADANQIIQSLAARAMGHRASMSSALSSGNFTNLVRDEAARAGGGQPGGGINSFKMPLNLLGGNSTAPGSGTRNGHQQRLSYSHNRSGSASSSWNRQSLTGALGFGSNPSLGANRLPTHSEASGASSANRSGASSDTNSDPVVVVDSSTQLKSTSASLKGNSAPKARRESVTADKALREVEKALQSVEAQG